MVIASKVVSVEFKQALDKLECLLFIGKIKRKEIMLRIGDRVKLITFNGETPSPEDCESEENYWCLIGELNTFIEPRCQACKPFTKMSINLNFMEVI